MAHPQQLCYVRTLARHLTDDYTNIKILEIGSYNVNGTIRDFFNGSDYVGTDLTEGPGVDFVSDGHLIDHDDNSYDITVSCECFEHNPYWLDTFRNMYRMTKDGGLVIFTCATRGRLEHGTQRTDPNISPGSQDVGWDYYRNLEESDFESNIYFDELFNSHLFLTNNHSKDLYFVGVKTGGDKKFTFDKDRFFEEHTYEQIKVERDLRPRDLFEKLFLISKIFALMPTRLLALLPERHFQNCATAYMGFIRLLAIPLKKIIQNRSKSTLPQP